MRLADSGQLGDLSWLGTLSAVNHVEYRDDRFVAALDLKPDQPAFRLVYPGARRHAWGLCDAGGVCGGHV